MSEEESRSEASAALDPIVQAKVSLSPLGPDEREKVAKWIESKFAKLRTRIAQADALIAKGGYDAILVKQVAYWRTAVAVSAQLAYYARTERGGPQYKKGTGK
jgi:hypothetical protein